MMKHFKKSLYGLYYTIIGVLFAIIIWPFGNEFISVITFIVGVILVINGAFLIFIYGRLDSYNKKLGIMYLIEGLVRVILGLAVIFLPVNVFSTIIGVILLMFTLYTAIKTKKCKDLYGKSLYKILIALFLIFCGIDQIGLWILRIIDILLILYGIGLMILATILNRKQNNNYQNNENKELTDVEFEEVNDD